MAYKVFWKVKGSRKQIAKFKNKAGKLSAMAFKKHLNQVYGSNVKIKIKKVVN